MTMPSRYSEELGPRSKISQISLAGDFQSPLAVNTAKGHCPCAIGLSVSDLQP
jgi:hypothetical protein